MCQESKARQIFAKTNISYSMIRTRTCVYQGIRNVRFSENLAQFVFLKHPVWGSSFCLITHDFRIYFIKDGTLCDSTFWKEENSLRKKLKFFLHIKCKVVHHSRWYRFHLWFSHFVSLWLTFLDIFNKVLC